MSHVIYSDMLAIPPTHRFIIHPFPINDVKRHGC